MKYKCRSPLCKNLVGKSKFGEYLLLYGGNDVLLLPMIVVINNLSNHTYVLKASTL
jgi:hypothetical protein